MPHSRGPFFTGGPLSSGGAVAAGTAPPADPLAEFVKIKDYQAALAGINTRLTAHDNQINTIQIDLQNLNARVKKLEDKVGIGLPTYSTARTVLRLRQLQDAGVRTNFLEVLQKDEIPDAQGNAILREMDTQYIEFRLSPGETLIFKNREALAEVVIQQVPHLLKRVPFGFIPIMCRVQIQGDSSGGSGNGTEFGSDTWIGIPLWHYPHFFSATGAADEPSPVITGFNAETEERSAVSSPQTFAWDAGVVHIAMSFWPNRTIMTKTNYDLQTTPYLWDLGGWENVTIKQLYGRILLF